MIVNEPALQVARVATRLTVGRPFVIKADAKRARLGQRAAVVSTHRGSFEREEVPLDRRATDKR